MSKLENDLKVPFWKDYLCEGDDPTEFDSDERFDLIRDDFENEVVNLYPNPESITEDGIGGWYDNAKRFLERVEEAVDFISNSIELNGLDEDRIWEFIELELGWQISDRNRY